MDNQRHLYAVISDIHANYQALLAVEKDAQNLAQAERLGEPNFICLGDVVDYGPQPNECMDWVRQRADITIQGNHDAAAADAWYALPHDINWDLWPITLWTRKELADDHKHAIREWKPKRCAPPGLESLTFFHSSLVSKTGYVDDYPGGNLQRLRTHYGLCGHTHVQEYFVEESDGKPPTVFLGCPEQVDTARLRTWRWQAAPVGSWESMPWRRVIFNPGSVGQPRPDYLLMPLDAAIDRRAAYMLLLIGSNGRGHFQLRRVDYDVDETVRQLREKVRWSENGKRAPEGSDILPNDKDPLEGLWAPDKAHLKEMLPEMPERLLRLVEESLIPTLKGRS